MKDSANSVRLALFTGCRECIALESISTGFVIPAPKSGNLGKKGRSMAVAYTVLFSSFFLGGLIVWSIMSGMFWVLWVMVMLVLVAIAIFGW